MLPIQEQENVLGVELGQLLSDDYTITHQVGEYAKTHGFTGVIAPSARGDGGVNW